MYRFFLAASLMLAACTSAWAQKSSAWEQQQYTEAVHRWQERLFVAQIAEACDLRSPQWLDVLSQGYAQYVETAARTLHVPPRDDSASYLTTEKQRQLWAKYPCERLVNSPAMDTLDLIHDRLTGGYR